MRRRLLAAVLLGVLAGGTLTGLTAHPAAADSPQARAAALAVQVRQLQDAAEQASEAYDAAEAQLGTVTAQRFAADRAADDAQSTATQTSAAGGASVRQLFELGGPAVLYTAALTHGTDLTSVSTGMLVASNVVDGDRTMAAAAARSAGDAASARTSADTLAQRQRDLEAQAAANVQQIQQDLARTQQLQASADAEVQALLAQQQAQQLTREHQQFEQAMTASRAGGAAGGSYAGQLADAPPAPTAAAAVALRYAESLEGHPYQWGGTGPVGYDCSGTTQASYAAAGIHLPRTAAQQWSSGPHVSLGELAPGDLLFWGDGSGDPAAIHHVAIYAGNGLMVSANHTGDTVRLQPVWWNGYFGASRPSA